MSMIARAFSLRIVFFSLLASVGFWVLVSLVWPGVGYWLMWLIAAATYALAVWGGCEGQGQMVKCPRCSKRVKLGANTCHHCGYTTAT